SGEAQEVVEVVVMVVVVGFFNQVLDMAKLVDVTRNADGTVVLKSVLFLGFPQQFHEERVVDVDQWDDDLQLLLCALSHHHR
ncbi:hypothetical protein U1Q18_031845, partial [Sarracenia purpurea var. burkii]